MVQKFRIINFNVQQKTTLEVEVQAGSNQAGGVRQIEDAANDEN